MQVGLPAYNAFIVNSYAGETVPLAATQTTGNVQFHNTPSAAAYDVIVQNVGPSIAYVGFGTASTTAAVVPGTSGTTNAFPVQVGAIITLQKNTGQTQNSYCAAICDTGNTATLYFTAIQGS